MKPSLLAAAIVALALLTFFQFPGHTWLQQDSQIYTPFLEHLRDPSVLRNDVLVQRPHVSFTLYDEVALALRRITGLGFHAVLAAVQIATRALGIWGVYLMAAAAGLSGGLALAATAIVSLGASIAGPAVLTLEYEPIPRGLAVPLQVCAVGLSAHGRYVGAGLAATAGFLIHAPTVYPFWGLYFLLSLWPADPAVMKRRIYGLFCLLAGVVVLLAASRYQAGARESQVFFSTLTPLQEQLQRMRASYVWISMWGASVWPHYVAVCALLCAAYLRVRRHMPAVLRIFVLGLPAIGLLSVPASYVLLERMRWALIPQFQPMRALLFVVLTMQFLTAVAALAAGAERRYTEAFGWFAAAFLIPLFPRIDAVPEWRRVEALLLLSALATAAMWLWTRKGWRRMALGAAVVAAYWVVPVVGGVVNYPRLHTPELAQLSRWAKQNTPLDSVFLFADSPRSMDPGVFRSEALRAVYVDWKGGGQVNYLKELGEQWWFRWQQTLGAGFKPGDLPRYAALGIQYVVLRPANRLAGQAPQFENAKYLVYRVK